MTFKHQALELQESMPLVYTALSKHLYYFRTQISKFVVEKKCVPLNPFMVFDYFLTDTVDRNLIRTANNVLIRRSDELWIFGAISNGVLAEIIQAKKSQKPIRYFKVIKSLTIEEDTPETVELEDEVAEFRNTLLE